MNILPFVCALLVIFGLLSTSLFRERLTLNNLNSACRGSMRAARISRNYLEAGEYKKHKMITTSTPGESKTPSVTQEKEESDEIVSHRDEKIFTSNTKLNLSPLFTQKNPLLYKTASQYIRTLYQSASFYKEGLENQILDLLIAKGAKLKQCSSFAELFPETPAQRTIFYKMLKGTGSYDLDTGQGFPPFDNYFYLDGGDKSKGLHFRHAPTRLLCSLFGHALTQEILKEEAAAHTRLSKTKLTELLVKNHLNLQDFESVLNFSCPKMAQQLVSITDGQSGISVQTWEQVK